MWAARPHLANIFEKIVGSKNFHLPTARFLQQTSVYFSPHRSYYLYHYGKRRCSLWQISLGKGYSAARIPSPSLQRLPLPAKKKGKGRCLPASTASVLTAISDRLPGNRQKELYNGKRFLSPSKKQAYNQNSLTASLPATWSINVPAVPMDCEGWKFLFWASMERVPPCQKGYCWHHS